MRQPPTYTSWKITCHSPEEVLSLQQWLSGRIDLDRVVTDTIRVMPNGVEQVQNVQHRLGDYFASIRMLQDSQLTPLSFKLVFQRKPEAGRFWKDLMVNILREIETTPQKASIVLDSKGEMESTCTFPNQTDRTSQSLLASSPHETLTNEVDTTMNDHLIRHIYLDRRIELYEDYLPADWVKNIFKTVESTPVLNHILMDLTLAWRTTAYTASMPAILIKSVQASTLGYANFVSPNASIISFTDAILAKLSRKLPELVDDRELRARLATEITTITDEFRNLRAAEVQEISIGPIWEEFLAQEMFQMGVWSSQRVAYVAFYNAYEAFLIHSLKHVLSVSSLRTNNKEFEEALHKEFGIDISVPCWTNSELNNARLVRHALSHAGGRETDNLKNQKQKHDIRLLDGVLQIIPEDNHKLLRKLRDGVSALVAVAVTHPRFTLPSG
jgi:hypothetical protein